MMEKQQSESRECEYALEISIRMAVWINKSALTDFSFKYLHQQDLKKNLGNVVITISFMLNHSIFFLSAILKFTR